jgi:hypothetical protein
MKDIFNKKRNVYYETIGVIVCCEREVCVTFVSVVCVAWYLRLFLCCIFYLRNYLTDWNEISHCGSILKIMWVNIILGSRVAQSV